MGRAPFACHCCVVGFHGKVVVWRVVVVGSRPHPADAVSGCGFVSAARLRGSSTRIPHTTITPSPSLHLATRQHSTAHRLDCLFV